MSATKDGKFANLRAYISLLLILTVTLAGGLPPALRQPTGFSVLPLKQTQYRT